MTNPRVIRNWEEFLTSLDVGADALRSVAHNISRTVAGFEDDVRTPLMKDKSDDEIRKIIETEVFDVNDPLEEPLMKIEETQLSKLGPRSIAQSWEERKESVYKYFTYPWKEYSEPLAQVERLGSLRPLDPASAAKHLPNATSSGLPYMRRKGLVKEIAVRDLHDLLRKRFPSVMFTRTQEGRKTRTVFGVPIANVIYESMYYRPYLGVARKNGWRSALHGPDAVDVAVTQLINHALATSIKLVSIDFSSYDQSISPALQADAFTYIKSHFQEKYHDVIDIIEDDFRSLGLLTPDGIVEGDHGVPSGSAFTNELDSIVQFLIARRVYAEAVAHYFQIQGDDGAYAVADPERLFDGFGQFGLAVNKEKSDISPHYLVFLQRFYSPKYRRSTGIIGGIYPVARAFNRLCHMERFTDLEREGITGRDFFSIRALAILENCKYHPWFRRLVRTVLRYDREGLKFTDQGLRSYIQYLNSRDRKSVV